MFHLQAGCRRTSGRVDCKDEHQGQRVYNQPRVDAQRPQYTPALDGVQVAGYPGRGEHNNAFQTILLG